MGFLPESEVLTYGGAGTVIAEVRDMSLPRSVQADATTIKIYCAGCVPQVEEHKDKV
jgi:hypothetical protein